MLFSSYFERVRQILTDSRTKEDSLNSPQMTVLHRQVLMEKPFLQELYRCYYADFAEIDSKISDRLGTSLELGSGGGFLKDVLPTVQTSDLCSFDWTDRVENAYQLSFRAESLKAIYMLQVFHHIGDAPTFFKELSRCLCPGGFIVMIEPHLSYFGRFFFRKLHHEACDPDSPNWTFPQTGRLSEANTALPYLVFERDLKIFENCYPELKVVQRKFHTFLLYTLSGGVSLRVSMPGFLFKPLLVFEKALAPLMKKYLGTMQTIVIQKRLV